MMAVLGQIVAGWLLADLLSGILHWVEDRLLPEGLPIIDSQIVQPNLLHHTEPMAFTEGGFLDRNLTTWISTTVIALPAFWLLGPSIWLATAVIGGAVASQVHYWAHRPPEAGSIVRTMQACGLIQSPGCHARHHRGTQDSAYCILTDWLNPWLDRWAIFPRIERALGVA